MAESRTKQRDGIKKPPGLETAFKPVLSVSPSDEDCASLEHIFKSGWIVIASATVASALSVLREIPIPVVICECDISGTWGEMLDHLDLIPDPPLLIVTSRLADERLWAEALNLGAWNVPFVAVEKAAETLANRNLLTALPRLRTPDRTKTFIELLEDFGSALVERIAGAYRELSIWPNPAEARRFDGIGGAQ